MAIGKKDWTRWFTKWGHWTWPVIAIIGLLFIWVAKTLTSEGSGWFVFSFVCAALLSFGLSVASTQKKDWEVVKPPIWLMVVAMCTPIILWFFWALKPDWYEEWRRSTFFPLFILTAIILGWLSTHEKNQVAATARTSLIVLCLAAVGVGAYKKIFKDKNLFTSSPSASTPVVIEEVEPPSLPIIPADSPVIVVLRGSLPAKAIIPVGMQMDAWFDTAQVSTTKKWNGPNIVRHFSLKPGVDSAQVKTHFYPCSTKHPCS